MLCISYLNITFPSPLRHSRVFPILCDLVQSPSPMHLFLETAINNYEEKYLQFHRMQEHSLPFHQPSYKSEAIHAFYLDHCDSTHRSHNNLHDRIELGRTSQLFAYRISFTYSEKLPIHFALINQSNCSVYFHRIDFTHLMWNVTETIISRDRCRLQTCPHRLVPSCVDSPRFGELHRS